MWQTPFSPVIVYLTCENNNKVGLLIRYCKCTVKVVLRTNGTYTALFQPENWKHVNIGNRTWNKLNTIMQSCNKALLQITFYESSEWNLLKNQSTAFRGAPNFEGLLAKDGSLFFCYWPLIITLWSILLATVISLQPSHQRLEWVREGPNCHWRRHPYSAAV